MTEYFLALFLTLQPTVAPQVVAPFENERDCRTAAVKANEMPITKSEEGRKNGALFACLKLVSD